MSASRSRQTFIALVLANAMMVTTAAAQTTAPTPPPAPAPAPLTPATKDQGFVSKKTGKSFNQSGIEDITNQNFPDMIESFDYPNADIADVVKAISELTGRNFVVDPNVRGKITIIAPSRITVAEAYKAFLSALAINGLAVVPADGFYKIKQARAAQRDNIETFSGAYYPTSDQMITRIIKLKYISAEDVNKQLRILTSKDGEVMAYTPTNSLIISDYGANIDRVMKILSQLDVQGFEERMEVIRIKYARAKDLADLIDKIINKDQKSGSNFRNGIPRFRRAGVSESSSSSGAEVYSVVVPDERTNSIIVVGNKAGISKIRQLVSRLDFRLRPDEGGGVFVYYVRHSEAEQIAKTLNGIATDSKKAQDQTKQGGRPGFNANAGTQTESAAVFGGDVKVTSDKITNSLVITASKQDYDIVKNILAKLDIPRDQVYIKAIIMEMGANTGTTWGVNYYSFAKGTNGVGRIGFSGGNLQKIIDPSNDNGSILGFGSGDLVDIKIGGQTFTVKSLTGLINLFKHNSSVNILSTPQLMAMDNVEAKIEVGDKVPVAVNQQTGASGITSNNVERENVTTKLTITPYISPDNDEVQMKINQEVADLSNKQVPASATELAKAAISTSTRNIQTQIVVNSGDTAVLGGLIKDDERESVTKVPILGDIPILGWLFKSRSVSKEKTNLMVFITPKIIRNQEDNSTILNEKINQRIDFIQRSLNGVDPFGRAIDNLPRKAAATPGTLKDDPSTEEPAVETF